MKPSRSILFAAALFAAPLVAPLGAQRPHMIEQTAFDDPPSGRGVDRFAKLFVQRGGFNGVQAQPSSLADKNLRAEGKRLPTAVVLRTFKMETDVLAFEDRDARALAEEERPQRRSQGGALFVVGKKALDPGPSNMLADYLALHGITAEEHLIDAQNRPIGSVLLEEAEKLGADLLVVGGYGHSRLREFILGGVTRGMLASMTVPCFMSH